MDAEKYILQDGIGAGRRQGDGQESEYNSNNGDIEEEV